ncbi:MAG: hypothetical protein ACD_51C00100G0002 [uncultured bacterium]|nr:MAG: hypothetical protein ACD_51C00100G0002 [uncultured bacterium]KKT02560.1 MAG: Urea transporter, urea transporter [Candidatus Peregrinibacteria bacterium GW2011_GWF2_43_17]KKT20555.1 MAG: Urea transporter [Candidatus Peregrinibacteria bacterium GW2011_GWA2_43_8]HAU39926.1 urea transporter [Candidatus Peregrinibacteria bacterium]
MKYLKTFLRGVGQVMLQKNSITGLLFLAGIFYNSWLMGIGTVVGLVAGTFTAYILRYKNIEDGLFGFNGVLVGIAVLFFFQPTALAFLLLIIGAILSSVIMNFMVKKNLHPYTFPFILSTWILIFLIKNFDLIPANVSESASMNGLDALSSVSMGIGQVMFQGSIITGAIFFVALLVNSRSAALYGLAGSALGMGIAYLLGFSLDSINIGIYGFNAVLCAIAFSEKKSLIPYALLSAALSVFVIQGMSYMGLPALTFPFVLSTWIALGARKVANSFLTCIIVFSVQILNFQ